MIDLSTDLINFPKFDQSVLEFYFLALGKSLIRFLILHFISFVINCRLSRFSNSVGDIIIYYI